MTGTVVPLPVFSVVEMCSGISLHSFYIPDFSGMINPCFFESFQYLFHMKFCNYLLLQCIKATLCRSPATEATNLLSTVWNMSDIHGLCLHIHGLTMGKLSFRMLWKTLFFPEVKHEMLNHRTRIQCIFDFYFYLLLVVMSYSDSVAKQNDALHPAVCIFFQSMV